MKKKNTDIMVTILIVALTALITILLNRALVSAYGDCKCNLFWSLLILIVLIPVKIIHMIRKTSNNVYFIPIVIILVIQVLMYIFPEFYYGVCGIFGRGC